MEFPDELRSEHIERFLDEAYLLFLDHDAMRVEAASPMVQNGLSYESVAYRADFFSNRLARDFPLLFSENLPFLRIYAAEERRSDFDPPTYHTSADLFIGNAEAIYDFTRFGNESLRSDDSAIRGIHELLFRKVGIARGRTLTRGLERKAFKVEGLERSVLVPKLTFQEKLKLLHDSKIPCAVREMYHYFWKRSAIDIRNLKGGRDLNGA